MKLNLIEEGAQPASSGTVSLPPAEPQLSVIVPFRDEGHASWFLPRLEELCQSFPHRSDIEFLVVDSGSIPDARAQCAKICDQHNIRYLYLETEHEIFSIGAARDYGARRARGEAVTFFDIDWRVPADFWNRLLKFMIASGVPRYKKRFFVIPALYLSESGTAEFCSRETDDRFLDFKLRWLYGDKQSVLEMAPCSSVAVINRLHYLSIGGHHPEFRGHGYEDFELYHRLIGEEETLPPPDVYYTDTKTWDTATYRGFRSRLALLGRAALITDLFVVHLWHPRPQTLSFYQPKRMQATRNLWQILFKEFDKTNDHPDPLTDSTAESKNLFLGEPRSNSVRCLRDAIPLLGSLFHASEFDYIGQDGAFLESDFESMVKRRHIGAILFTNPYWNNARLAIYTWCRRIGFPYIVFERGALPDSWFFDDKGFNADSASYNREHWDRPLSTDEDREVTSYIRQCLTGDKSLEKQGIRRGAAALATKLRIGRRKVLFVPLQRPSDTVTLHMAGAVESCTKFISIIDEAALHLKRHGYIVLCKKHPLETESPPLMHARYVPDDTHFLDLLELADAVALINSGVGVYAMMMEKPCFIFGQAFYAFDGVNKAITTDNVKDIARQVVEGFPVDMTTVRRFVHYLVNEFYSFGHAKVLMRTEKDGSLRSVTTAVDFYHLKLPGREPVRYASDKLQPIPQSAPLFERYKLDLFQRKQAAEKLAQRGAVPVTTLRPTAHTAAKTTVTRKLNKLLRSPHAFFADSHIGVLRPLKNLFPQ